eukprot:3541-Heterococcus_DN1.PRE.2
MWERIELSFLAVVVQHGMRRDHVQCAGSETLCTGCCEVLIYRAAAAVLADDCGNGCANGFYSGFDNVCNCTSTSELQEKAATAIELLPTHA